MEQNSIADEKLRKQVVIVKSIILDEDGNMLFVRRNRPWHKEAHDKWEFAGGKIEFGELPEETAVREAKEETGYDVEVLYLLPKILSAKWDYGDRESQQILICYVCKKTGGDADASDKGVSELRWFSITDHDLPRKEECLDGTIEFLQEFINHNLKKGK